VVVNEPFIHSDTGPAEGAYELRRFPELIVGFQGFTTIATTTSTPPSTLATDRQQDMLQTVQLATATTTLLLHTYPNYVFPVATLVFDPTTWGNYMIPRMS